MLELKSIKKTYKVGEIETKALDGVSVAFRDKEFVTILGASGSGKTTCLNVIGGLDHYDEGDLVIKGKSTKNFKNAEWDAYRNNSIGFVFQSYNLISHLSIVSNVEMSMTLSGVSNEEKHKKAIEVLEKVGLKEHLHKRPNQLSGGQMQRVAIARALANDPEILLCDEPTGALDSVTSVQIMDLIKEVAKDRLVIMVTHNPELAEEYADRIIRFADGKIIDDTHPHKERPKEDNFHLKKTSMNFLTAINLSFNNLRTKKGRTLLTAFASSIGIIGIAVILSLSTGLKGEIDKFQADAMSEFPIYMVETSQKLETDRLAEMNDMGDRFRGKSKYANTKDIQLVDSDKKIVTHTNDFSDEFMDYVKKTDKDICSSIGYIRTVNLNIVRKDNDDYKKVEFANDIINGFNGMTSTSSIGTACCPDSLEKDGDYLKENYEVLSGEYPKSKTDVVLVLNTKNELEKKTLKQLGYDIKEDKKTLAFDKIVGATFKIIQNNDTYIKTPQGMFVPSNDYKTMYDAKDSIEVKVTGVVRAKKGSKMAFLSQGIAYKDDLIKEIIEKNKESDIVKAQKESDKNVITNEKIEPVAKKYVVEAFAGDMRPAAIMMFPKTFDAKDKLLDYLDKYNKGKSDENKIVYEDLAKSMSEMTGGIMDGITLVLIGFASISLVVSMIMISIITYISVLERTKEIGILKALGARKKDITRVFNAETMILGVFSGVLGVIVAGLCTIPINDMINKKTGLEHASNLKIEHAIILVIISTIITMIGGFIPSRLASKKDAVEALRTD